MSFLQDIGSGLLNIGLDLFSANQQSKDIKGATNEQVWAQQRALDEQKRQFDIGLEAQKPRLAVGNAALSQLAGLYDLGVGPIGSASQTEYSGGPGIDRSGIGNTGLRDTGAARPGDYETRMNLSAFNPSYKQFNLLESLRNGALEVPKEKFMAEGGVAQPGNQYIVGEEGPEVLTMNDDGTGYVTPNPSTLARLAGFRALGGAVMKRPVSRMLNMINQNAATSGYQPSGSGMDGGVLPGYYPGQGADMGQVQNTMAPAPAPSSDAPWSPQGYLAGLNTQTAGPTDPFAFKPTSQSEAFGKFFTSPGYQFRLGEGLKATERSAAARSGALGGNTLKALQRYGEGLAANEFYDYRNTLQSIAGLGQTASNAASNLAAEQGVRNAGLLSQMGQTNASGLLGQANTQANAYANIGKTLGGIDWGSIFGGGSTTPAATPMTSSLFDYGNFVNDASKLPWPRG